MTRIAHVNGWEPAVYMRYTSQIFHLFPASNLSVPSFRIFLLVYPGSVAVSAGPEEADGSVEGRVIDQSRRHCWPQFGGVRIDSWLVIGRGIGFHRLWLTLKV